MFEKSLSDLVKGIRANKRSPSAFISASILECKKELKDPNEFVKANAIRKLTFLRMMGYEFSWANFATIEVMSSQRFGHKRVGYLSAAQSFNEETDVILLTTNLLKKEFGSSNVYEVGLAINCLSNIVTPDLARELLPDLTQLTQHSHGYIRKKAVLCLFKLFMKYPQGLRLTFDRIKQCLDDSEPAVVSCAVNVITELADKNPKNYLLMAPHFFSLLTSSSNNWMLIKVVKLLGSLVSEEPRLARKLLEPLAAIVENTQAKSLLYEAVYTLTLALPFAKKSDGSVSKAVPGIVDLCADKLKSFVEELDQNLKYLGLVGFVSLMRSYPKAVVNHRNLILRCLCDDDVTIRSRALELLTGMVTRKNLQELVDQLMQHVRLSEGDYRDELIQKIIFMCSRDKYAFLTDFKWYISVLVVMSRLHGTEHGDVISSQIMDVAARVFPVRDFCVGKMVGLLLKSEVVMGKSKSTIWEVLHAAAWVVGEYSNFIDSVDLQENVPVSLHHSLISVLLSPSSLGLPSRTQAVFVQAAIKIFAAACNSGSTKPEQLVMCLDIFQANLTLWMKSKDVEVQERASSCYRFLIVFGLLRPTKEPELVTLELDVMSNQEGASLESSKVEIDENESPQADDLLGLVMATTIETPVLPVDVDSTIITVDNTGSGDGSFGRVLDTTLTERCREHASALLTVCVPEPMKPVNAKAQKRLTPPSFHGFEGSLRAGLFHDLIKEDSMVSRKRKMTIEEVSFGFFGARATRSQPSSSGTISFDENGETSDVSLAMSGNGKGPTLKDTPSQLSHLQNISPPGDRVDGTPFYLTDSGVAGGNYSDDGDDDADADFGEIRLGVSDSDDDNSREGAKKPARGKGKKKKSKKKKERKTDDSFSMREDALAIFGGGGVGVYRSDEEANDDESEELTGGRVREAGQEFDGLAQIDLTTPLAPDEVMPERKHREVPEHSIELASKQIKKKKEKREKKPKRTKAAKKKEEEDVADLLDFGATNDVKVSEFRGKEAEIAPSALNTIAGNLLATVSSTMQDSSAISLNLKPDEMATLDSLASEFVTGEWTEVSTKVKNESGATSPIHVIARMLNASFVEGSISDDGSCASLAATGKGRKKLRVLVKCKGKVIKLDFKSNSKKLAKSASKMFKELVL